jgi:hypothetical protein
MAAPDISRSAPYYINGDVTAACDEYTKPEENAIMKKERQIGLRVGLPVFFALEVEDVYRHTSGAHRALAFPDFLGLLIGLGLEAYRKQRRQEEPDAPETGAALQGREMPWY